MIIDAKHQIIGRVATFAAKKALLGEQVNIINCEQALITGNKSDIVAKYMQRIARGQPGQGPYISRRSDFLVKRLLRGMLPYKKTRGKAALSRIRCYTGTPEEIKGEAITVKGAEAGKLPNFNYMTIKQLCTLIHRP